MIHKIEELARVVADSKDLIREAKHQLVRDENSLKEVIIEGGFVELLTVNHGRLSDLINPRKRRRD